MSNHTPLTDEELAKWKAICDAATPGPWGRIKRHPTWIYDGALSSIGSMDSEKDTVWIIAACAGWPRCIEEVERLRAEVERLNEALDGAKRLLGCQQLILDSKGQPL